MQSEIESLKSENKKLRADLERLRALEAGYQAKLRALRAESSSEHKIQTQFLSNMSHEIRTQMNAIIGMSELTLITGLTERQRGYVSQIRRSGKALLSIVNDLLDFSKIESGKLKIVAAEYDLFRTMFEVCGISLVRVKDRNVEMSLEIDPGLPAEISGDSTRVRQVIFNLVGNAAKFSRKKRIVIRVENLAGKSGAGALSGQPGIFVSVTDSGQGIRQKDFEKIFNAFQQVDMRASRKTGGMGLGLAISRKLVTLMGGDIGVKSEYGKGSCFYFALPDGGGRGTAAARGDAADGAARENASAFAADGAADAGTAAARETAAASAREKTGGRPHGQTVGERYAALLQGEARTEGGLVSIPVARRVNTPEYAAVLCETAADISFCAPSARILVVDDNQVNLQVAEGLLAGFSVRADFAESGPDCLEKMFGRNGRGGKKYDLVFLDQMMPGMDGIETLQKIRRAEGVTALRTPVVALSANAVSGAREMFIKSGFDDFIAKPVQGTDFADSLLKWLPENLIERSGDADSDGARGAAGGKKPFLPDDFPPFDAEKLDARLGIASTGGFENWLKIVRTFAHSVGRDSRNIENFWREKNFRDYTVAVHALKSSARVLGASALSEMAARLEQCGKAAAAVSSARDGAGQGGDSAAGDTARDAIFAIDEETPALLLLYRSYSETLLPVERYIAEKERAASSSSGGCPSAPSAGESPADSSAQAAAACASAGEIRPLLERLISAASACDLSTVDKTYAALRALSLPDTFRAELSALNDAVEEIEFEAIIRIARPLAGLP